MTHGARRLLVVLIGCFIGAAIYDVFRKVRREKTYPPAIQITNSTLGRNCEMLVRHTAEGRITTITCSEDAGR